MKSTRQPELVNTTSLREVLTGRVCIVGVGNRRRGDDGAGPRLIDARPPGSPGVWLDAGIAPENYLEPIVKSRPDTVLIVDVVTFGGVPGETRLMDVKTLDTFAVSTHAGSLCLVSEYLAARSHARVYVLAIQPEILDPNAGMSSAVEESVRELAELISDIISQSQ